VEEELRPLCRTAAADDFPERPAPDRNISMHLDQLCDRLFHGDDDFWRASQAVAPGATTSVSALTLDRRALRRAPRRVSSSAPAAPRPRASWLTKCGWVTLLVTLLGSAFGLWKGYEADHATIRPIQDYRVGQRALGDAPAEALATDIARRNGLAVTWDASDGSLAVAGMTDPLRQLRAEASAAEIRCADYRKIVIEAQDSWPDGTVDDIQVETLQPWQWIDAHEVHVGGQAPLPLDVVEMGLPEGITGTVRDILPCPPFRAGRGRVIVTTVNHLNRDVWELTLRDRDGTVETVRPTGAHLFYSHSRGQWLAASELQAGERLDGVSGPVAVVSARRIPGTHRVYNFTVQGEHLYRVAQAGVLVHNNCDNLVTQIGLPGGQKIDLNRGRLATRLEGHEVGQGFSTVFDETRGTIHFRPSPSRRGAPVADGWVPRGAGHATVSAELGGDPVRHHGLAIILQKDATLRVTWLSGTLNKTPDSLVPMALRPTIVEAIEYATGRTVSSY
jgi:hypothetical protein